MISQFGDYHSDKLGYYQVGDFRTYSKMEAIELHRLTGVHPTWIFNDSEFSTYDWTQEPPQSLWDLYTQRARDLRERHDYIILQYSGGADSDMMCRAFIENGIPFEEMITGCFGDIDRDTASFSNREVIEWALPRAQAWLDQGHQFRYRVVNWGQWVVDAFQDPDWIKNWIYYFNNNYGLTRIGRSEFRNRDPYYRELLDRDLKVCFVAGCDKPRLYRIDNRFCLRFLDLIDNIVPPKLQMQRHPNCVDELFFWSPDAKDLLCKQGHELRKFFRQRELLWQEFDQRPIYQDGAYANLSPEDIWLTEGNASTVMRNSEIIHHIIYPGHRPQTVNYKFQYTFWSLQDEIFQNHPDIRPRMLAGIQKLHSVDPYWLSDRDMKLCISPPYFLE